MTINKSKLRTFSGWEVQTENWKTIIDFSVENLL